MKKKSQRGSKLPFQLLLSFFFVIIPLPGYFFFFATFLYNKQIIINSSSAFIISTLMGFWAWMNEGSVKFFFYIFFYSSHLLVSWSIFDFILMMIWWIDDGNEIQNPLVKKKGLYCSIVPWVILVCIKIDLRLIMSHIGMRRNWR